MSLPLWPGSAGHSRKAPRRSRLHSAPFVDQESSRVRFSGSPVCPKNVAGMDLFLLGGGAAGEGGAWLPGGSWWPQHTWGAASACCSSCFLRLSGLHQARLYCVSSDYAESFEVTGMGVLK